MRPVKLTETALDFQEPALELNALPAASPRGKTSIVDALFRQHARRVQHFMGFRLRSSEDGRDAAQDVFLKVWRREVEGGLRNEATSYLYSATRTSIIDAERQRTSRGHGLQEEAEIDALAAAAPEQDEALHWRKAMEHFVHVIEVLPNLTKQAFVLHYFNGMNYDEIAAELGANRRTIERHVARAMSHCRLRMRDYL
jgi:RNA polymerase sigma-19 factor, ECF subfamily